MDALISVPPSSARRDRPTFLMRSPIRWSWLLLTLVFSVGERGTAAEPASSQRPASNAGAFVAGRDYTVLERRRFLDTMGFDRPVEAFSMLFPKDWTSEGGVRWKGVQECRGEIVSTHVKAASPDGQIQFEAMPVRSFVWAEDPMMRQAMQAGARQGGCQLNGTFTAAQYIEGFAQRDLGARASDIRADESHAEFAREFDRQANAISRQYGTGTEQQTTFSFGQLKWPDGREGILHVGVSNMVTRKPNFIGGGSTSFSSTNVLHCVLIRFAPARREEATRLMGMLQSSSRTNPTWQQARDNFLTQLGNVEHAGRMEIIRLFGEQSRAYAQAQSDASDRRLRDWERQQASQDRQHKKFVQTIREVETYADAHSKVELSSGYRRAWSRGDGTYLLSNTPGFDPGRVFQDRAWTEMKKPSPERACADWPGARYDYFPLVFSAAASQPPSHFASTTPL